MMWCLEKTREGARNNTLWRECMRQAHSCDDFGTLLDVARWHNENELVPPLSDEEVIKVTKSAWDKTVRGENRIGKPGVWLSAPTLERLVVSDQDGLVLLAFLRHHNGPGSTFPIANGVKSHPTPGLTQFR
jgi:hypothetical protein